jgi:hypothetical protein
MSGKLMGLSSMQRMVLVTLACVLFGVAMAWSLRSMPAAGVSEASSALLKSEDVAPTLAAVRSITTNSTPPCEARSTCCASTGGTHQPQRCDAAALLLEMQRALVSVDDAERERGYTQLLPILIALDASAVARLIENTPSGPAREELLHHAARTWTATDADGAIEWAATLSDDDGRLAVAADIASQLAQSDPASAIEVSDLFGIGRDNGVVEHLAQVWAADNLHEVLEWIRQQPASAQRDQLLARVLAVQAEAEPANAAEAALSSELVSHQ